MSKPIRTGKRKSVAGLIILGIFIILFCLSLLAPLSPTKSLVKTIGFVLTGRLHFPVDKVGQVVMDKDGNSFTVFREVVVDPTRDQPSRPGFTLILHFRVTNLTVAQNKVYALLPLPLYLGDPGFRSKLFTINGENCQSIYQWDTLADVQAYLNSFAIKSVSGRSVPGSFSYEIIENQ